MHPLIRRDGKLKIASWDQAMKLIVRRTKEIQKQYTDGAPRLTHPSRAALTVTLYVEPHEPYNSNFQFPIFIQRNFLFLARITCEV
jgi:anaerobic selenocysteine-containing dehydrogenase